MLERKLETVRFVKYCRFHGGLYTISWRPLNNLKVTAELLEILLCDTEVGGVNEGYP
jgi:hypothetical protein